MTTYDRHLRVTPCRGRQQPQEKLGTASARVRKEPRQIGADDVIQVGAGELGGTGEAMFRTDRSGTPTVTVDIDAGKIDLAGLKRAPAREGALDRRPAARPAPPAARVASAILASSILLHSAAIRASSRVTEAVATAC